MQRPFDTRVDSVVGREVALRDGGIDAVVSARVDKIGAAYVLSARVTDPVNGDEIANVRQSPIVKRQLIHAVGRLALGLRERLGESTPRRDDAAALPKVSTASLPALQLYARAVAMQDSEGGWSNRASVAEQLLRQAVEKDPEFASAHMVLPIAVRLQSLTRLPEALQHMERAAATARRASDVERLVIGAELLGTRAELTPEAHQRRALFEQAAAAFEAVLEIQPDHPQALICVTNIYEIHLRRPSRKFAVRLANLQALARDGQLDKAISVLQEMSLQRIAMFAHPIHARMGMGDDARHPGSHLSPGGTRGRG